MSTKAVCRVLPVPRSAAGVLQYCYRQRRRDGAREKAEVLAVAAHAECGVLVREARMDSEVMKSRCPLGKNPVKHVVISPEQDGPDAVKRLVKAGEDWCRRFAPGRSFVLVVHKPDKDAPHTHLHIVVESYNAEKALHWSREEAVEMSGMKFTKAFSAVREDGSRSPRRGANKVYPHAKGLKAKEVADMLQAGETWASLKEKKIIQDAPPRRGREDVTSFVYQGKRIRFATVEKLKASAPVVKPVEVKPAVPVVPVRQPVATPARELPKKSKEEIAQDLAREAALAAVDLTRKGLGGLVENFEEVIDDLYKDKEQKQQAARVRTR